MRQFFGILIGHRGGQINFIQDRDDGEIIFHRQVQVSEGLRLNTLRRIHQKQRTLARGKRARDLIGEVHVAGRVNHIQRIGGALHLPRHTHRLRFNGDTALALNVHAVKVLRLHIARGNHTGCLEHTVSESGLAVINMRNNAEVANNRGVGGRRDGRVLRQRSHSLQSFQGCSPQIIGIAI